jgi:uncharacterized membrane protein YeaQ/YmgE (transglycosylase-associated protein family)
MQAYLFSPGLPSPSPLHRKADRLNGESATGGGRRNEGAIMVGSLVVLILVGLVAGWLAGKIVQGTGYGLIGDIAIGIAGALIAGWLFPMIGLSLGGGIIAAIIHATIGAVLLLVIIRLVKNGGKW